MHWFPAYNYILASKSPRRQKLLKDLGLPFSVLGANACEEFPEGLLPEQIPVFLARRKAEQFSEKLKKGDMLITADTIVCMEGEVFGKPESRGQAREMLTRLSGKTHQVITGVCLKTVDREKTFFSVTDVEFKILSADEIDHYIETCSPFDKAGGYGIQEWIGLSGVVSIRGSYFNVVGLPVQQLYDEIFNFSNY